MPQIGDTKPIVSGPYAGQTAEFDGTGWAVKFAGSQPPQDEDFSGGDFAVAASKPTSIGGPGNFWDKLYGEYSQIGEYLKGVGKSVPRAAVGAVGATADLAQRAGIPSEFLPLPLKPEMWGEGGPGTKASTAFAPTNPQQEKGELAGDVGMAMLLGRRVPSKEAGLMDKAKYVLGETATQTGLEAAQSGKVDESEMAIAAATAPLAALGVRGGKAAMPRDITDPAYSKAIAEELGIRLTAYQKYGGTLRGYAEYIARRGVGGTEVMRTVDELARKDVKTLVSRVTKNVPLEGKETFGKRLWLALDNAKQGTIEAYKAVKDPLVKDVEVAPDTLKGLLPYLDEVERKWSGLLEISKGIGKNEQLSYAMSLAGDIKAQVLLPEKIAQAKAALSNLSADPGLRAVVQAGGDANKYVTELAALAAQQPPRVMLEDVGNLRSILFEFSNPDSMAQFTEVGRRSIRHVNEGVHKVMVDQIAATHGQAAATEFEAASSLFRASMEEFDVQGVREILERTKWVGEGVTKRLATPTKGFEEVVDVVKGSGNKFSTSQSIRRILGDEASEKLEWAVLDDILEDVTRDPGGEWTKNLESVVRQWGDEKLRAVFGSNPQALDNIHGLATIADRIRSTGGGERNWVMLGQGIGAASAVVGGGYSVITGDERGLLVAGVGGLMVLSPRMLATLIRRGANRQLFETAAKTDARSQMGRLLASKIMALAGRPETPKSPNWTEYDTRAY